MPQADGTRKGKSNTFIGNSSKVPTLQKQVCLDFGMFCLFKVYSMDSDYYDLLDAEKWTRLRLL